MADHPDELHTLRERAYGPDADIHHDPTALQRLRELENEALARSAVASPASEAPAASPASLERPDSDERRVAAPAPTPADGASDPGEPDPEGDPESEPDAEPRAAADESAHRPWWRRRVPLLVLIGSIVATVLVTVPTTLWISQVQAGVVAVLGVAPDDAWPEEIFGPKNDDSLVFDEFSGLTVAMLPQDGDQRCLYVLDTAQNGPIVSTAGCAGGSFPPSASLAVAGFAPQELRDRFPEGTALQFVLDGSQVFVYADIP